MRITSPAFSNNTLIPKKYTCDGEDVNPPLEFHEVPANAKSLALIVDDPDAPMGTWVHWVLFNIPPNYKGIEENSVPEGAIEGINDFKKLKYGGPCPPSGTHRYFFKLYALDSLINLKGTIKKDDLERAMKGHIIEKAELIGLYSRSR
ncbi:MAG: YbhB/YbcL family Raf kinase inhibitor-like protein [Proteobacteria bacterium]|nr:YbhB/YbcL family Raf kinase inhibitor-like protein [Pseudomonadota bacterium]